MDGKEEIKRTWEQFRRPSKSAHKVLARGDSVQHVIDMETKLQGASGASVHVQPIIIRLGKDNIRIYNLLALSMSYKELSPLIRVAGDNVRR